ncbi:MAG: hypothetical protein ACI83P_002248 [Janthinobacterium sp.]|jgi:hypothetical protein
MRWQRTEPKNYSIDHREWHMFEVTRLRKLATRLLATGMLAAALVACSGGDTSGACVNLDPARSGDLPGCPSTASGVVSLPLFTSAPSAITLPFGGVVTYVIDGGTAPYTATGSNARVVSTNVAGSVLSISAFEAGNAQIAVVDTAGKTVNINVTVGAENTLFTTAPGAIAIATGSTPGYAIGGGTAPFTATSGNAGVATADVSGTSLKIKGITEGTTQIAIIDASGKSVTISVTVGASSNLYTTAPSAIAIAIGNTPSYRIGGGFGPYTTTSSNANVATTSVSGTTFNIKGISVGTAQIAIVDAAGRTVNIAVTMGTANPLFTTAPNAVTIATGTDANYTVGGGSGPYNATSSNTGVATVSASGTTLTILAIKDGPAQIAVVDASGRYVTINVTVASATPLVTSAPNISVIVIGATANYTISGGAAPYTATSSNVATASAGINGTTLSISAASSGAAQIALVDAAGRSVTVNVMVYPPASLAVTAPGNITIATGAQSSYSISGGIGPYTATSSNTAVANAGATASILNIIAMAAGNAQVVVQDAASGSVTINVAVAQKASTPIDVLPNGASANVGDTLNFRLSGGAPAYAVTVNNPNITTVTPDVIGSDGGTFTATLHNVGITTVAVVDALGQTRTFTLIANQASSLLRLSPAMLTVSESLLDPIALNIYGGTGPYRAYTSDEEKSSVSVTGAILTIGLGTKGTRCFPAVYSTPQATYDVTITVIDHAGASATSVMSIQDNMPTPVCP